MARKLKSSLSVQTRLRLNLRQTLLSPWHSLVRVHTDTQATIIKPSDFLTQTDQAETVFE